VKRTILSAILLLIGPLAHATERAVPLRDAVYWVRYYARVYEVPVELVEAVIDVESGWDPLALSPKGAVGLMQLMPGTAVRFGVWNRFHVQDNIRGGVAYLAWLIRAFRGDLRMVTAAYFVGESSIRSRGLAYSSPEVYRYVSRVAELFRSKRLESAVRQSSTKGLMPQ
jgi:soluble lytic murein transglycosylase-like protein